MPLLQILDRFQVLERKHFPQTYMHFTSQVSLSESKWDSFCYWTVFISLAVVVTSYMHSSYWAKHLAGYYSGEVKWSEGHSVMSDSATPWTIQSSRLTLLWPHRLWPVRFLYPWDSLGKNTGVGCHFLLQGIFPTQRSDPCLLHSQGNSLSLSHQGSHLFY